MELKINGKKRRSKKKNHKVVYQAPKTKSILTSTNARYIKGIPQPMQNRNKWYIQTATKFQQELISKATVCEVSLCNFLHVKGNKVDFKKIVYVDYNLIIQKFYIVDIYLPKYNLVIEVDGEYHNTSDQIMKDQIRSSDLKSMGYKVFRCKNEDTFNLELLYGKILKAAKTIY
jgi:very-short-patch-repair endonuclease